MLAQNLNQLFLKSALDGLMQMNYFIIMRNCSLCCGFNSLITEITLVLCARDKHRLLIHSANSGMTGIGQDSASAALQKAKPRSSQHLKMLSELLRVCSPRGINECLQQSISFSGCPCVDPKESCLDCAYSWWLEVLGLTDIWDIYLFSMTAFTAPEREITLEMVSLRCEGQTVVLLCWLLISEQGTH